MTSRFRSTVYGEMLRCGQRCKILRVSTLQSRNKCNAHLRRQKRVFAVRFLAPPPTGIAKNVDIRRPDGEAMKPTAAPLRAQFLVIFRAKLRGDDSSLGVKQFRIEAGCHANRLR